MLCDKSFVNLPKFNIASSIFVRMSLPQRYVLAILAFLGMFCMYMTRININIAIIGMSSSGDQHEGLVSEWTLLSF